MQGPPVSGPGVSQPGPDPPISLIPIVTTQLAPRHPQCLWLILTTICNPASLSTSHPLQVLSPSARVPNWCSRDTRTPRNFGWTAWTAPVRTGNLRQRGRYPLETLEYPAEQSTGCQCQDRGSRTAGLRTSDFSHHFVMARCWYIFLIVCCV